MWCLCDWIWPVQNLLHSSLIGCSMLRHLSDWYNTLPGTLFVPVQQESITSVTAVTVCCLRVEGEAGKAPHLH